MTKPKPKSKKDCRDCKCIHHCTAWGNCDFHNEPACNCEGCVPEPKEYDKGCDQPEEKHTCKFGQTNDCNHIDHQVERGRVPLPSLSSKCECVHCKNKGYHCNECVRDCMVNQGYEWKHEPSECAPESETDKGRF